MSPELFKKYINNQCSIEEEQEVKAWLESASNKEEVLNQMDDYWKSLPEQKDYANLDSEKLFGKVLDTLNERASLSDKHPELRIHGRESQHEPRKFGRVLKYAASILIMFSLGLGFYYSSMNRKLGLSEAGENKDLRTRTKPDIKELVLADGTKVWLNSQSTLKYPEKFTGKTREVYLEGEAFFDVVKNPNQPFIVKTSGLDIRVLGTSFNVNSYKNDDNIYATLVTGKIFVDLPEGKTKNLILKPSEGIIFSKKSAELKKLDKADIQLHTAWKQGILVFKDAPFDEVVKRIERWYGVELSHSSIDTRDFRLTAKFEHETLEEVLEFIKLTFPFEYSINGNQVKIKYKQKK
jgi:transmembrane sensor